MAAYMNGQQIYRAPFGDPHLTSPQSETPLSSHENSDPVSEQESDYKIIIRQQPERGRVAQRKEKDRRHIDPPPIVQLTRTARSDPAQIYLQSPYYFMACTLIKGSEDDPDPNPNSMFGTLVSSLHKLRDLGNQDGGFFIFGELSIKIKGVFRLQFTLFQMKDSTCVFLDSATSQPFTVYPQKNFKGTAESTLLTRSFSDQGVRLQVRNHLRAMTTRKRNSQYAEVARRISEWDKKHSVVTRHSSINECDAIPTDHRGGLAPFASTGSGGYYEPHHRAHYAELHATQDMSYYRAERSSKRARHLNVGSAEHALPEFQQTCSGRQSALEPPVLLIMPPVSLTMPDGDDNGVGTGWDR